MFDFYAYFDWKDEGSSKKSEGKPNIFAVHFKRLNGYNKDWKIQKILMFEYMLVCGRKYGHEDFTQKTSMIVEATWMGKDSVYKYLKEIEDDGYLKIEKKKYKKLRNCSRYTINYEHIKNSLDKIYNFDGHKKEDVKTFKEELCKWYDYHSSSSYRDASNNNNKDTEDDDPGTSIT